MTQGEEKARERTADVGDEGAEETEHHQGARGRQQGEALLTPAHGPVRYASQGAPPRCSVIRDPSLARAIRAAIPTLGAMPNRLNAPGNRLCCPPRSLLVSCMTCCAR